MKNKLITTVKYFGFLYNIYYYIVNMLIAIMKVFVKPDDKLILINSYGGKKYGDSPRVLFEAMRSDSRYDTYKFVWAFREPDKFSVEGSDVIKIDTIKYYIVALKARCWITNSQIERGLDFKGKNTFYFNTWHGAPIKKIGSDLSSENKAFKAKSKNKTDIMNAQGKYDSEIVSRVLGIEKNKFLLCGLPRNDRLAHYTEKDRESIKKKLGLTDDRKVILYAPTFREFERDRNFNCELKPPMDLSKWKSELGEKYYLLFRAHYEVSNVMEIKNNDFVIDMTKYPELEDLMIVADVLISDYSSMYFDFSIMDKPMLHFTYDYDKFLKERGLYFDLREYISGADNETDLIAYIKDMDYDKEIMKTVVFRNKFVENYGNATKRSVDCIAENIGACNK